MPIVFWLIEVQPRASNLMPKLHHLFIFLVLLANAASSQSVAIDNSLTLLADKITLTEDSILIAEGNVEAQRGNQLLKASKLIFDDKTEEIFVENVTIFLEGQNTKILGDQGQLGLEMRAGLIQAANILVDEKLKISANEVFMDGGEVDRANNIWRVTTCKECEGKQPVWHFSARSAERNADRSEIMYKNVVLKVKGVPIAFTPYLRLPDPRISRARGFLMPSLEASSKLGTGVRIPYFVPIGDDKDLLFTPLLSTETNTLEYRYRQAFENGNLTVSGSFSKDTIRPNKLRYFIKADGSFVSASGYHFNFQSGKVSDDGYLGDYGYFSEDKFETRIKLKKEESDGKGNLKQSVELVRNDFFDNTMETDVTISVDYSRSIDQKLLPGQVLGFIGFTTGSSKSRDEQVTPFTTEVTAKLSHSYAQQIGKRLQISTLAETKISASLDPDNERSDNPQSQIRNKVGLFAKLPFTSSRAHLSQTFEPILALSYGNQTTDEAFEPFRSSSTVNIGELHKPSTLSGFSEDWEGFGASLGLNYAAYWKNGYTIKLSSGAPIVTNPVEIFASDSGFQDASIAYVLGGEFSTPELMSFRSKGLFTSKGEMVNAQSNLGFNFSFGDNWLASAGTNYDRLSDHQVSSEFSLSTAIGDWKISGKQGYLDGQRDTFEASAIYEDECTRFLVGMKNRFSSIGSSSSVQTFSVSVQLKH